MPESVFELSGKRVWVAGHGGMVGSALSRRLASENVELLTAGREEVDLRRQQVVEDWVARNRPEVVLLAAAKVGGIQANDTYPAEFLYENLMIEANCIDAAYRAGVERLVFLGSTCIYPRDAPQPISENALLSGPLESTNEWYAIAKIAGLKLCQSYRRQYGCDFISVLPTNLYGPHDNYDLETAHVLPALLRKAHEARSCGAPSVEIWGSGTSLREFLHVDDLADAVVFITKNYSDEQHINVGSGEEVSIQTLAALICEVVGFKGALVFDAAKPDGTPRKLTDTGRLAALGWNQSRSLEQGLAQTYAWCRAESVLFR